MEGRSGRRRPERSGRTSAEACGTRPVPPSSVRSVVVEGRVGGPLVVEARVCLLGGGWKGQREEPLRTRRGWRVRLGLVDEAAAPTSRAPSVLPPTPPAENALSALVGGKHYVVDTSRNGLGDAGGEWCTPGRTRSRSETAVDHGQHSLRRLPLDQSPGYSDGACNGGPSWGLAGRLTLPARQLVGSTRDLLVA